MSPQNEEILLDLADYSHRHYDPYGKVADLLKLFSGYKLLVGENMIEIVYLYGPQGPTDGGCWVDESAAEEKIRERYPEAVFTEWEENNEPEALFDEFVKYAVVGDKPVAALYEMI